MLRLENDVVEIVLRSKYICAYILRVNYLQREEGKNGANYILRIISLQIYDKCFCTFKIKKKKGKNSISKIKNRTSF